MRRTGRPTGGRRRLARKTQRLPRLSRQIYRIDHYSSKSAAAPVMLVLIASLVVVGTTLGFDQSWIILYTTLTQAVTLVMVFVIQHTAGREQAATQRKLDELLRAIPQATESLMLLEEAPEDVLHQVEEQQRSEQGLA